MTEIRSDDASLRHRQGTPHETAAVLRMHRAGMYPYQIARTLGISKTQLIHELNQAIDDEQDAGRRGVPIHDAKPAKVLTAEKNAKDVEAGEFLMGYTFVKDVHEEPAHYDGLERKTIPAYVTITFIDGRKISIPPFDKVRTYREPAIV